MIDAHTRAGHIRRDLLTITDHYDQALHTPRAADESGIRGASSREPVPIRVLDARAEVHRDLHFWARFILDEINDGSISVGPRSTSIAHLAEFVGRWAQAVCEQAPDDADNLETEMRRHAGGLLALARGWSTKRIEIARCPEQTLVVVPYPVTGDVEEFVPCTGSLWAILRSQDTMLSKEVACDHDPAHAWQPWQWRDLGRRLGLTIAEISTADEAVEQGVSQRTIQRRRTLRGA